LTNAAFQNTGLFINTFSAPVFQSRTTPDSTPEKSEDMSWPENINSNEKQIGGRYFNFKLFYVCRLLVLLFACGFCG